MYRKVYKDCTVRFECSSYVLPHTLVGKDVVLRVKDGRMRIFHEDCLVIVYDIPEGKGHLVKDTRFYEQLKKDRQVNERKYGHRLRAKGRARQTISPKAPLYDLDVAIRPIHIYDTVAGR